MLKRNTVFSRGTSRFKGVSFVGRPDGTHKWEARLGLKCEAEVGGGGCGQVSPVGWKVTFTVVDKH